MSRWTALLALVLTSEIFLLTNAESHPEWLRALGLDWWGLADARDVLMAERRRAARCEESLALVQHNTDMRRQTARELLDGRLDLFAAAARFHALNQRQTSLEKALVRLYPRMSPEERTCRHMLDWIKQENIRTPAWPACREVLQRLEAELEYHLCVDGGVKLPSGPM